MMRVCGWVTNTTHLTRLSSRIRLRIGLWQVSCCNYQCAKRICHTRKIGINPDLYHIVHLSGTGLLGSLHVYDRIAMTWTDLSASVYGITPTARYTHGFASADGKLFVHGGCSYAACPADDLHVFDPVEKVWTDLSAPAGGIAPTARYSHGFTSADGKLYVHGGCAIDVCPVNDLHVYDPVAMAWTQLYAAASPSPRFYHGFTAAGGRLYVHGGKGINGEIQTLNFISVIYDNCIC